ncbi:DUF4446 family protein [Candidatus Gottesmanbacteria bacterium]|nr:DUF4446 family protein [Candidatus Gottesmanbacteria bacterium]
MEANVFIALLVIIFVWMTILTVMVIRAVGHYNRLSSGVTKSGLKDVLERILASHTNSQKQIIAIKQILEQVIADGRKHIQRMGVVRFNPFHDTGGSQSFAMAILDGEGNGFVMTSLFARTGHRWYVKQVQGGRGKDFELSKEEERAISIARPV